MNKNTKSPITDKLLRQPGQSLDEEIQNILDDKITPYIIASALAIFITFYEWYRLYFETPPMPWLLTSLTILTVSYSLYKIIPLRKKLKAMRQGSEGEKAVAELLVFFREAKMKVLHDVVGNNFNLDHVVVSTRGVFLIETKTYSKPLKGKAEITFDGKVIYKNGISIGDDIVIQVKAGSKWLSDLIEEITARKYDVQPIVVFPGWFVKMTPGNTSGIWVLNPKVIGTFIDKKEETLSEEEVKLISNHLGRYIRGK